MMGVNLTWYGYWSIVVLCVHTGQWLIRIALVICKRKSDLYFSHNRLLFETVHYPPLQRRHRRTIYSCWFRNGPVLESLDHSKLHGSTQDLGGCCQTSSRGKTRRKTPIGEKNSEKNPQKVEYHMISWLSSLVMSGDAIAEEEMLCWVTVGSGDQSQI